MDKIHLPQLAKMPEGTETIEFREFIAGLETLTPVQGTLRVKHSGTFLEVSIEATTIVTLTCDRTLQQFNHKLVVQTSELIWLTDAVPEESYPREVELEIRDLVETLPPSGSFDPNQWIYEQCMLAMPVRQIAPDAPAPITSERVEESVDGRWSALRSLYVSDTP